MKCTEEGHEVPAVMECSVLGCNALKSVGNERSFRRNMFCSLLVLLSCFAHF
jgi:hypothetical protein